MLKFYSASKFTQAAIEMFDAGTPMNPAGVRGFATIFTYDDTAGEYNGKTLAIGDRIMASSTPEYIAAVNAALTAGLNVDYTTARAMGYWLNVIIKGKRDVVQSKPTTESQTIEETQAAIPSGGETPLDDTHGGSTNTVDNPAETLQEDAVVADVSNTIVDTGDKADAPNFDHAESLKASATPKKDLEAYALTFGVQLDRRKSFDAMMVTFRNGL